MVLLLKQREIKNYSVRHCFVSILNGNLKDCNCRQSFSFISEKLVHARSKSGLSSMIIEVDKKVECNS